MIKRHRFGQTSGCQLERSAVDLVAHVRAASVALANQIAMVVWVNIRIVKIDRDIVTVAMCPSGAYATRRAVGVDHQASAPIMP
jgi:hypothetical protein